MIQATNKSKSVAVVAHAWNDDLTGGSFKVATEFARYMAAAGHEVHYLTGSESGSSNVEVVDDVRVWRYQYPTQSGPAALLAHVRRMSDLFLRVQREVAFDAVSGHTPLQHLAVVRHRKASPSTRFTFTVHSPFVDELQAAGRSSRLTTAVGRWIDRVCLDRSDHVTTDSQYTMDRMSELYKLAGDKMSVRSPWVDLDRFQLGDCKDDLRAELGTPWKAGMPTFVTIRRLEKRMGLDQLIDAAKRIIDQGHEFRLMIGGSGSMHGQLREQIDALGLSDSVFLLGRVPESQLAASFAAADCFVLPTKALECFGLITLESYACGVPVIATPVAAIPEIVLQHDADWLTTGTSSDEIAVKLRQFLDGELKHDPQHLRTIAESYSLQQRASALEATLLGVDHHLEDCHYVQQEVVSP